MKVKREQIIKFLSSGLKKNPSVFAFWLEGADSTDSVDKYSDIDIWLDVKDGDEENVLKEVERILLDLSDIDFQHEESHPHPKIRQMFFHLKGTPEFLVIDICIQSHSRIFWFTKRMIGEKIKIIFEKGDIIKFRDLDQEAFQKEIKCRIDYLKKTFPFFMVWVNKEIQRGNLLEALEYYHIRILEPLVELLRIRYVPSKYNYYLKHIYRDLPKDTVKKLENLYNIKNFSEMRRKIKIAKKLFEKVLNEIKSSI